MRKEIKEVYTYILSPWDSEKQWAIDHKSCLVGYDLFFWREYGTLRKKIHTNNIGNKKMVVHVNVDIYGYGQGQDFFLELILPLEVEKIKIAVNKDQRVSI